ncbi:class I SAM-dependent methyltransferase [Proteiniphilum sp. X52]|uniref:class I SAM-dependent methyltransferase n=1 Tax=Proteiniphilum sp. X52 TaxID=2382159 RepID=UPI000F0A731B|nr:class I SAM-dependent methyltransferase [Proteiniphilum sp. X52]RNC66156.1 class I SAM-dependent methyltransferase [Proteiniphilum sp. X52]
MSTNEKSYKFWDRVSGWSKAESAANSTLVECLNSRFGIHIMPDDTVLDFGCGTGTITLRIAKNANMVYGVDVSEGMLKRAQKNVEKQNIENVTFAKITTFNKMFNEDFFNVITTFNVFQYVENRKDLFEQFYKLLKPQGLLIIAVPCFGEMNSISALLVKFLRFFRIMPETYAFGEDEIEKEITDTGFSIIESIHLSNLPEKFIVARKDI